MAKTAAVLTLRDIEKSFGPRHVLRGVSFTVHEGERVGLVGVNGSGKSTLLRLTMEALSASSGSFSEGTTEAAMEVDSGEFSSKRGLLAHYVPQEPVLDNSALVGDALQHSLAAKALRLGVSADELSYEIRGLAASLSLPAMTAQIGTLSGGERRRVGLAQALLIEPALLALDEPTNHLDMQTIAWLGQRLAEFPGTILLVTHDRYFLDSIATRILELDRGQIFSYEGNYSEFLLRQAERHAQENASEHARATFVKRELDWIRSNPSARRTKQQARIDRFDQAVAAKPNSGDKLTQLTLQLPPGPRLGKTILELAAVQKSMGDKLLFRNLELALKPGDRVGIIGPNGSGKTTLINVMMGRLKPDGGEVKIGQNTQFAFLDQERTQLAPDKTVLEEVAGDHDHVFLPDGPIHVRSFLRMLQFSDATCDTRIAELSGGERNRVQLARLLRIGGNFLVLDEPTNDLDLVTLSVLEDALIDFPGCALVVSHDRWFLDKIATAILAFEEDGQVIFHEGNYSAYLGRKAPNKSAQKSSSTGKKESIAPPISGEAAVSKKLSYKENRELEGMEAAISEAEVAVAGFEKTLADPDIYRTQAAQVPELVASLEAAKRKVESLYARWQELSARQSN